MRLWPACGVGLPVVASPSPLFKGSNGLAPPEGGEGGGLKKFQMRKIKI